MTGSLEALHAVTYGLQTGGIFFYKALWSILFGVAVTAAIDVFVDKEKMARLLGGWDVRTIGVAAATGAASSACTFGAVTIAQALYKKGASLESTFAFALAATNIVFELSVLIYLLLGGAVLAAEFLSGVTLVVIMFALVRLTLPVQTFELARSRLQERDGGMPASGIGSPIATSARSTASGRAWSSDSSPPASSSRWCPRASGRCCSCRR